MDDQTAKDQPQLVTVKRINSTYKRNPSNTSTTSLQDDQMLPSTPPPLPTHMEKHGSQSSLQTSSARSSISNIFKVNNFFHLINSMFIFYSQLINELNDRILIMESL
jgi:hypothetical protein